MARRPAPPSGPPVPSGAATRRGTPVLAVLALALALTGPALVLAGSPSGAAATGHPSHRSTDISMGSHVGGNNSLDWAGYAVDGPTVTSVAGSWTQPSVTCPTKKANQSAFWVGIDGYVSTDPTVQQVGTDADCLKGTRKVPGGPSYYAWYELFPGAIAVLPVSTHPVSPGDVLDGAVSESGSSVTVSITDAGRWTFATTLTAVTLPLGASAEWIAEAPTACGATKCKPVKLADFGSVAFTAATANGLPVDAPAFTDHQITMTKNKKGTIVKASTSALSGGSAFDVTWVSP